MEVRPVSFLSSAVCFLLPLNAPSFLFKQSALSFCIVTQLIVSPYRFHCTLFPQSSIPSLLPPPLQATKSPLMTSRSGECVFLLSADSSSFLPPSVLLFVSSLLEDESVRLLAVSGCWRRCSIPYAAQSAALSS